MNQGEICDSGKCIITNKWVKHIQILINAVRLVDMKEQNQNEQLYTK